MSIPQYGYPTIVATESFVNGTDYSIGNWTEITSREIDDRYNAWPPMSVWNNWQEFQRMQANANNTALYERLDNRQCIERYADVYSNRSSLIVVTEELPGDKNASVFQYVFWPAVYGGYSRYNPCTDKDARPGSPDCQDVSMNKPEQYLPERWTKFGRGVLYCLSKRITDHCQVNYSPIIFIGRQYLK